MANRSWIRQNQIPKEYYKEYFAITEQIFLKPREFKILKRLGPCLQCSRERMLG